MAPETNDRELLQETGCPVVRRVLIIAAALLQGACATRDVVPERPLPASTYQEAAGLAYLWTSGESRFRVFSLSDFATVTRIDGIDIQSPYAPGAGSEPWVAALLEIPAGRHSVEILYKEETLICSIFGCITVEKSTQAIEFVAEPGQTYTPMVRDHCARAWFWIEDGGPYTPGSPATRLVLPSEENLPVVAGAAPGDVPCEHSAGRDD